MAMADIFSRCRYPGHRQTHPNRSPMKSCRKMITRRKMILVIITTPGRNNPGPFAPALAPNRPLIADLPILRRCADRSLWARSGRVDPGVCQDCGICPECLTGVNRFTAQVVGQRPFQRLYDRCIVSISKGSRQNAGRTDALKVGSCEARRSIIACSSAVAWATVSPGIVRHSISDGNGRRTC